MRLFLTSLLLLWGAAAYAQPSQCEDGADMQRRLERLVERRGEEHPRVVALATEIRELQRELLDANPDKTIEEICNVEETASNESDDDELICRREQVVGSHRRIRVCATRAEREATRRESQESLRTITRGL